MEKEIAIRAENISKTFRIPHEKISTLRGAFVNAFHSKGYEEFNALDDVSFEVKKGEFFGIIGRNGSGKSTLLKILAGIYQPDMGRIKVNGLISPFLELGIGFNPELSGRDNIYLNATVLGLTKEQIDEKFDDIVRFSELRRFIDQKVKNYSSGMQVRLMFSVAIHANREVLLMDEVLAVGDTNFQGKCLEEFNKYRNQGKTVVLVTHDIATVQKYCDRAMLLREGKIQMIGDPEKVSDEYVYQNMSDEEKRIFEEEKSRKEEIEKDLERKRKGKGTSKNYETKEKKKRKKAEIIKVELLDETGKEKNVFKTGDTMKVRILFEKAKSVGEINIGVGLYSDNNCYIFSYNTQMDNYTIDSESEITLLIHSMPLLHGSYYLNAVCFGNIEQEYYDFKPQFKRFGFYSNGIKSRYRGFLDIGHEWQKT